MIALAVPDMSCGHCRAAVTEAIAALDPAATVRIDADRRRIEVEGHAAPDAVIRALADAGYPATAA
jgi:copper chaperone